MLLSRQAPFVTFHFRVAEVPAGTPVIVVVGEEGVVMVAVPLTTLHSPVPGLGVFAAIVNVPLLHCAGYDPATAVTGALLVSVVLSTTLHAPFVTVHFKVAEVPTGIVTEVFGNEGLVMVAEPLTNVQSPVPGLGLFAAMVKEPLLH